MAILKAVNVKVGRKASLKGIINYVLQPHKTEEQLVTGICCDVPKALETFLDTKKLFGKEKGRQYYHLVQSFPPNENLTAEQAHEAALKFAEACKKFWGFEMLVVTHKDRKHLHSHFVINSVSFIDGRKFHITRKELAAMKELQNQICVQLGYSPAPKKGFDIFGKLRKKARADNSKTFHALSKSESGGEKSYLRDCANSIIKAIKLAHTKEQFIQLMKAQGFDTDWKDNKKHVVFCAKKLRAKGVKKCKVRLKKLSQYFPELKDFKSKEDLLNGIVNRRIVITGIASDERENGTAEKGYDFNAEYERYSAQVDRERAERAAEENSRRVCRDGKENVEREQSILSNSKRPTKKNSGLSRASR